MNLITGGSYLTPASLKPTTTFTWRLTMTTMSLTEYSNQMRMHDYSYMMSDDPQVYEKGQRKAMQLKRMAEGNNLFREIYTAYQQYWWHKGEKPRIIEVRYKGECISGKMYKAVKADDGVPPRRRQYVLVEDPPGTLTWFSTNNRDWEPEAEILPHVFFDIVK